jgi:hypothetical protein
MSFRFSKLLSVLEEVDKVSAFEDAFVAFLELRPPVDHRHNWAESAMAADHMYTRYPDVTSCDGELNLCWERSLGALILAEDHYLFAMYQVAHEISILEF